LVYKIRFTPSARKDARTYATFIRDKHKSPAAAKQWLDGLNAAILELVDLPRRYSVIAESDALGGEFRSFVYHSHRVIYAVHEKNRSVVILRIYPGASRPLTLEDF
jgi:plasmid stabilization system protein ParE